MTALAILTPSYRPDLEGFRRLHASVLRHTDGDVMHHVIVPGRDAQQFRAIGSDRLAVWTYREVLPPHLVPTGLMAAAMRKIPGWPSSVNCAAINRYRPWRPVRGWVLQQIVKMCMVDVLDADIFLNVDSDVVLVREVNAQHFLEGDTVRLYAWEGAVRPDMGHHRWVETAHRLLGLPWNSEDHYPDHIAGLVSWDTRLLRDCLAHVEEVTGRPWAAAIAEQLYFSEDILYGTYVRAFGDVQDRANQHATTLCHSYWEPEAMTAADVDGFVERFAEEHRAVHIQSNTDTDDQIFRTVIQRLSGQATP
ncbi:DUF6492 family protein [Citricoccus nitrophenolicus]|uniref:DUF6492 family protein n=1 Tax=Citricoccus nitrophenolicus TaxID=863575 RepID=UPI0031E5F01C